MRKKHLTTKWQSLLANYYEIQLVKFQFPKIENLEEFKRFEGVEEDHINKIISLFKRRMMDSYPEHSGIMMKIRIQSEEVIKFCIYCKQRCLRYGESICPMVFHYDYDVVGRSFTLTWFKNEHIHYPIEIDTQTIKNIHKTKKKLLKMFDENKITLKQNAVLPLFLQQEYNQEKNINQDQDGQQRVNK